MTEVYQYKLIEIPIYRLHSDSLEHQLNDLGLEGWYVLSTQPNYLLLERVREVAEFSESPGIISSDLAAGL